MKIQRKDYLQKTGIEDRISLEAKGIHSIVTFYAAIISYTNYIMSSIKFDQHEILIRFKMNSVLGPLKYLKYKINSVIHFSFLLVIFCIPY